MTQQSIEDYVLGMERFRRAVLAETLSSVARDMPAIRPAFDQLDDDWRFSILCSSALISAPSTEAQDSALRIIQGCLQSESATEVEKEAAAVLLERAGNQPSLALAADRDLVPQDSWTDAPAPIQLDVIRKKLELQVVLSNGQVIKANTFQRAFWTAAGRTQWLSISAPTSAGKSYIVKQYLLHRGLEAERFTALYLVPTRALIEEVSQDLQDYFGGDIAVLTMPWDASAGHNLREVYVLTQERAHLIQQAGPSFRPSVIFVDEAQKIGEDSRGVLLQQVVDEAARRDPGAQVIFASPLSSNPELLLEAAPAGATTTALNSSAVTVNQNLIWADQVRGSTTTWTATLMHQGNPHVVGQFTLPNRPTTTRLRLSLVAVALGGHTVGNVVYCNGAAEAEVVAGQIFDALGEQADLTARQDIRDLQELAQTAIHNQYALSRVLGRGVAFHYGNMPLIVKAEIERLFRNGVLRYLICTSTLLEGVNLPCRNLFTRGPRKGNNRPMTLPDFWNLAGRAGRWGKEFQGNIVCIDPLRAEVWRGEVPVSRAAQPMARATDAVITAPNDLIDLILAGADYEPTDETSVLDAVFNFLSSRIARGISLEDIRGLPAENHDAIIEIESAIEQALDELDIPEPVISRHSGINPFRMQLLADHFAGLPDTQLTALRLPGPEDSSAVTLYAEALGVIQDELSPAFGNDARQFQLALLIVQWMRGYPLARIIRERQNFLISRGRDFQLPRLIRDVMADVEQVARFSAPKYLACYLDILDREIASRGLTTTNDGIDVEMMLELGVSRATDVSLMALGLSRASVVALSEYIVEDSWDTHECRDWLLEVDLDQLDIPHLVRREITDAIRRFD